MILLLLSQIQEKIIIKDYGVKQFIKPIEETKGEMGTYTFIGSRYFEPSNEINVTDTFFIYYLVNVNNWNDGDTIFIYFKFPDFNEETGEPTGEYKTYVKTWRVKYYNPELYRTYVYYGGESDYTIVPSGVWVYYGKVENGTFGTGIKPKNPLKEEFFATAFFPGDWKVNVSLKVSGGSSESPLPPDIFHLNDNFTYFKIVYPENGDSVFDNEGIRYDVWENNWGKVYIEIKKIGSGNNVFSDSFNYYKMDYKMRNSVYFNFGRDYGEGYKIKGRIRDYRGNEMCDSVTVYVGHPVIQITLNPSEIQPYYENHIPLQESRANVIVEVRTRKGTPVGNFSVRLLAKRELYSGGHDHGTLEDPGPVGVFGATTGKTDENGRFTTTYTASAFGGVDSIFAFENIEHPKDTAKFALTVRVPGLIELSGESYYVLTGATALHPHNHFGTQNTINSIKSVARTYYDSTTHRLKINDISLPYGGLYDINGDWRRPHDTHRLGTNVDVSYKVLNGAGGEVDIDKELFELIVYEIGGDPRREDLRNHFHVTF